MWQLAVLFTLIFGALPAELAHAQTLVRVRDAGPGRAGRLLRAALGEPHVLLVPDTGVIALPRDSVFPRTVIIIGADATVASTVEGDVIVVGGDLFLHPGGLISGHAIAIGGGVYNSTLALVEGERIAFRDLTFVVTRDSGTVLLDYRALGDEPAPGVMLWGLYGLGLPGYTRVDGLSIPIGVAAEWDEPAIDALATITYRSHLGAADPRLRIGLRLDRRTRIELSAGRATLTNDDWIRGDALNSLLTVAIGRDARNYYRADRADLAVARLWETESAEYAPFISASIERAWSVGPLPGSTSAPWAVMGRDEVVDGMRRPNPPVLRGRISSARVGVRALWEEQGLEAAIRLGGEIPFQTPGDSRWQQLTLDTEVEFPTFGSHRLAVAAHVVTTFGDAAPPQRFAYLGGSGTLPTFDLLSFGGDELVFGEGRYIIPVERITVPYLGSPRVELRYMIGSAGVRTLPALEQNLGLRLALMPLKLDWTLEPISGDSEVSVGLTIGR
jgi:hypothetical protein